MRRTWPVVILICVCASTVASAAAYENGDWQLWNTDGIEVKLNDRWELKEEEELRFGNEVYSTDRVRRPL